MSNTKYSSIFNVVLAGFMAGVKTGKVQSQNASGAAVVPGDFGLSLTAGLLFATEVDAILQAVASPPAQLAAMVNDGATVVPSTAAEANAAETLPPAMAQICTSLWQGRTLPVDAVTGLPFTQADYQPMANAAAQQFLEFCTGTSNV